MMRTRAMSSTTGFRTARTGKTTPKKLLDDPKETEMKLKEIEEKQMNATARYYERLLEKAEASKMYSETTDHAQMKMKV